MFKRHTLAILLCVFSALQISDATAANAYILLSSNVTAAACTVETGLASGKSIPLGIFGRTKFQHAGDAGDWVDFSLNLLNCPPGTTKSTVTFTGTPDGMDPRLFANTEPAASAASHIAIQLAKGTDRNTLLSHNSTLDAFPGAGNTIVFPLSARMVTPTGGVRAGQVSGSVMVNFTYQ